MRFKSDSTFPGFSITLLKFSESEEKKKEEGTSDRSSKLHNVQVNVETLQHSLQDNASGLC